MDDNILHSSVHSLHMSVRVYSPNGRYVHPVFKKNVGKALEIFHPLNEREPMPAINLHRTLLLRKVALKWLLFMSNFS